VAGERLSPIPHQVTQRGLGPEFVVEADLCDSVDIAKGFAEFEIGVMGHAALKG